MIKDISKIFLFIVLSGTLINAQKNNKETVEPQKSGMHDFMQEMHEQFNKMDQKFRKMFTQGQQRVERAIDAFKDDQEQNKLIIKSMSPLIDIDEDKNIVRIVIKNVETDSFDDALHQKKSLTITTPHAEIVISLKGTLLSVDTIQEVKKEIDREGYSSHTESSSSSSVSKSLRGEVDFVKARVVFNKKSKELVVELPLIERDRAGSQSIPVVIK